MFRFESFKKSNEENNNNNLSFLERIISNNSNSSMSNERQKSTNSNVVAINSNTPIPVPTNSWGMLMLSQLQNQQEELDSVISTLLNDNKVKTKEKAECQFNVFIIMHRLYYYCLFLYHLTLQPLWIKNLLWITL